MDGLLKGPQARVEPARHFIDVFREELEDLIRAHASSKKGARAEGGVRKLMKGQAHEQCHFATRTPISSYTCIVAPIYASGVRREAEMCSNATTRTLKCPQCDASAVGVCPSCFASSTRRHCAHRRDMRRVCVHGVRR